jgi:hypothetical protein
MRDSINSHFMNNYMFYMFGYALITPLWLYQLILLSYKDIDAVLLIVYFVIGNMLVWLSGVIKLRWPNFLLIAKAVLVVGFVVQIGSLAKLVSIKFNNTLAFSFMIVMGAWSILYLYLFLLKQSDPERENNKTIAKKILKKFIATAALFYGPLLIFSRYNRGQIAAIVSKLPDMINAMGRQTAYENAEKMIASKIFIEKALIPFFVVGSLIVFFLFYKKATKSS